MNSKLIVGSVIALAGVGYLLAQGFFRASGFEDVNPSELAGISAYLVEGSMSSGGQGVFVGQLQPSWDEMGYAAKYEEAEKITAGLRALGVQQAYIRLDGRSVLDVGPTSMELYEAPRGVAPKRRSRPQTLPPALAPDAANP